MSKIIINGVTIQVEGGNVSIKNGQVIVDGVVVKTGLQGVVEIKWEGDLASLKSDASVTCQNVAGPVRAGGSVNCHDVEGNVDAGGSVNAGQVGGDIRAGGSVNHRR